MVAISKAPPAINDIPLRWGRMLCVHEDDYYCLYDYCKGYKDYVEIGSMFGTSAIVAGYAVTGEVHCIEPFGIKGQPNRKDRSGDFVKREYLEENWADHHDPERLKVYATKTPPWPIPERMFDVGLIDGSHKIEDVKLDWREMSKRVKYRALFHDVNKSAWSELTEFFHDIAKSPEWELLEVRGVMGVLEKVT